MNPSPYRRGSFSSFFAVRAGGYTPGVDRTPLPLDILLKDLHQGTKSEFRSGDKTLVKYPNGWGEFHPFSNGNISAEW